MTNSPPQPPAHLSPGAAGYLSSPDRLEYPDDWSDPWAVQEFREVSTPLWAEMNDIVKFGYDVTAETMAGVAIERIDVHGVKAKCTIVHLHGGMYCVGAPEISRCYTAPLARATEATVLSIDYRLAPEHRFPAAIDDVVSVCAAVADEGPFVLIGESAGGGLAVASTMRLAELGHALPQRVGLLSPMLDMTGSSDTYSTLVSADPDYSDTSVLLAPGGVYAGDQPLDHPLVSPLFASAEALSVLPPTMIQVGGREVLLGESARFARKARHAGASVTLDILDGGWHNYPLWHGVPEADEAVADMARFLTDPTA